VTTRAGARTCEVRALLQARSMRRTLTTLSTILLVACSGGDPGGGPSDPGDGSDDGGGAVATGTAPGTTKDAGPAKPPPLPDDPGVFVANPVDAFTGAPAYASAPPTIRANDQHPAPVTGKPCLECHDGTGSSIKFDFAGTVWIAPAKTLPAADTEVRIIDAKGMARSTHSDADGNFWHHSSTDLLLPAFSGARNSHYKAIGKLNGPSCNSCHENGAAHPGRLFVQ
jgi:hypothetical protein